MASAVSYTHLLNLVLAGMPGSGKTTLGKALAEALRRPFIDCDEAVSYTHLIDARLTDEALATCDLVIVALYPRDTVDYILSHAHLFRPGALVVDCAGVKRCVCDALFGAPALAHVTFMGGHPMAGREFSGFDYAKDDLFENASMILTLSLIHI